MTSCMYVSTASNLLTAVMKRDNSRIDLNITLIALGTAAIWAVYASLKRDVYFLIPNLVGLVVSVLQMTSYFLLPMYKPKHE